MDLAPVVDLFGVETCASVGRAVKTRRANRSDTETRNNRDIVGSFELVFLIEPVHQNAARTIRIKDCAALNS